MRRISLGVALLAVGMLTGLGSVALAQEQPEERDWTGRLEQWAEELQNRAGEAVERLEERVQGWLRSVEEQVPEETRRELERALEEGQQQAAQLARRIGRAMEELLQGLGRLSPWAEEHAPPPFESPYGPEGERWEVFEGPIREVPGEESWSEPDVDILLPEVVEEDSSIPDDDVYLDFQEAMEWHTAGAFEKSIAAFRSIAQAYPKSDLGVAAAYNVACGFSLSGDRERAFEWLHRAVDQGFQNWDLLETDTDLDPLRDDPRFAELLERHDTGTGERGA